MKTQREIEEMYGEQADAPDYAGMSYRDGVRDALQWVLEELTDSQLLGDDE